MTPNPPIGCRVSRLRFTGFRLRSLPATSVLFALSARPAGAPILSESAAYLPSHQPLTVPKPGPDPAERLGG